MDKIVKIVLVCFLMGLLVSIRAFENFLFYDPLLDFFKSDYTLKPLPEMDAFALQTSITLRFLLNTLISLGIIWIIFKDRGIIKISAILYLLLFIFLFLVFSYVIFNSTEIGTHMFLFYIRRFLIQPLFLFILLPAFYFQKYKWG